LVFAEDEAILTLGAMIAGEIFGKTIPIAAVDPESFARIAGQKVLTVDNGRVAFDRADSKHAVPAPAVRVNLTDADQTMLAGAEGKARQVAMRIITRFAEVQGVTELIDVDQAHIDCCFYTGPAGLAFAERICAWGGKVKVPATTNATSVDALLWRGEGVEASFGDISKRVIAAYTGMGVRPSFTCAPYLLESAPRFGQQIGWGESNAVAYANSVLGARTMKYPDYLDICVALTGRAPLMAGYLDSGRHATIRIDVPDLGTADDSLYPLLGYHVGLLAGWDIPVLTGLRDPSRDDLKAFSAAFATTSGAPMFHIEAVTPEAGTVAEALGGQPPERHIVLTRKDLLRSWHELNTAGDRKVDMVSLGNPHFSLAELARTAELCRGKQKAKDVSVVITCGRDLHAEAEKAGTIAALKALVHDLRAHAALRHAAADDQFREVCPLRAGHHAAGNALREPRSLHHCRDHRHDGRPAAALAAGLALPDRRDPFPILNVELGLFRAVFPIERDAVRVLQDVDLEAFFAQQAFIPRGVGHIADHDAVELPHIKQGGADIAGAQAGEQGRFAEIPAAGIADRRGLAVIIGMVLLDQGVVALADDPPRRVVDDHRTDRAAAFVIALLRQERRDPHEIRIAELLLKAVGHGRGEALGRQMRDQIQDFVAHRRRFGDMGHRRHGIALRGIGFADDGGERRG
jgi:predicted aconitase